MACGFQTIPFLIEPIHFLLKVHILHTETDFWDTRVASEEKSREKNPFVYPIKDARPVLKELNDVTKSVAQVAGDEPIGEELSRLLGSHFIKSVQNVLSACRGHERGWPESTPGMGVAIVDGPVALVSMEVPPYFETTRSKSTNKYL